jgi:endonuclease/exonuclease/phosphatase family metal-dependent hydrolase
VNADEATDTIDAARRLQRALYRAAKASPARRFHALYDKVDRKAILERAWQEVRANAGAAGVDGQTIKDVSEHPNYQNDGRIGTYDTGAPSNKIDYILLSPALFQAVTAAGVERRGVWGGKNGTLWTHYPEMNSASDAASDHAAIWADLAI